jgi:hypothetical protein
MSWQQNRDQENIARIVDWLGGWPEHVRTDRYCIRGCGWQTIPGCKLFNPPERIADAFLVLDMLEERLKRLGLHTKRFQLSKARFAQKNRGRGYPLVPGHLWYAEIEVSQPGPHPLVFVEASTEVTKERAITAAVLGVIDELKNRGFTDAAPPDQCLRDKN